MKTIFFSTYIVLTSLILNAQIFKENDKYGYKNKRGRMILAAEYDEIYSFDYGNILVARSGKKYGLIDTNGSIIILPYHTVSYDEIYTAKNPRPRKFNYVPEGLILVKLNHKYGFIDSTGREIIPPKYDKIIFSFNSIFDMGSYSSDQRIKRYLCINIITYEETFPKRSLECSNCNGVIIVCVNKKCGCVTSGKWGYAGWEVLPLSRINRVKETENAITLTRKTWSIGKKVVVVESPRPIPRKFH